MKNFLNKLIAHFGRRKSARISSINQATSSWHFSSSILIMMIIIPVSPSVIDNLIAINMTISITLLMVALYIPKAVQLSMFPSLLLITRFSV